MLNCRHTDRENRIGFHASDSKLAHTYLSFVRWLIFRYFARARKRNTPNWKILLCGENMEETNEIREYDAFVSRETFLFFISILRVGFFVCVRCYLPSPGSAQHSVTASTVITAGGGGGCCRLVETSLSMVSLHFRCLCRCAQSHSFPIHATHTHKPFYSFFFLLISHTFVACCWNPLKSLFQLFDVVSTQTLANGTKVIEFFSFVFSRSRICTAQKSV